MSLTENIKSKIVNAAIVNKAIAKTKSTTLPGFRNISLYDTIVRFREQILADNIIERASAISYNFTMALPPTIIFLFTLIPFFPISKQFIAEMYGLIRDIVPGPKNYTAIIHFLDDFINNPRNGLLSLGFLLSLFFSSNALMGVMRSFDKNYPGFTKRKGLKKRLAALKITLVLFLLFFLCITLIIAQGAVLKWLGIENEIVRIVIGKVRWILILLLFFLIIAYIYRHAPSVSKKWKIITPGSVIATILMLLCALVFSWWVSNFGSYNKLYGSIGTLIVLMALIFLNSLSLLIGFELNVSIYSLAKTAEDRKSLTTDDVIL